MVRPRLQQQQRLIASRHQLNRPAAVLAPSAAPATAAAAVVVALLALSAGLPGAAAVKAISSWNSGMITHLGGAQDGAFF